MTISFRIKSAIMAFVVYENNDLKKSISFHKLGNQCNNIQKNFFLPILTTGSDQRI